MTRLERLKEEQEFYLSLSKEELNKARQEAAEMRKTLPKSSFSAQAIGCAEYGTRDLSKEIEKEERNTSAIEYNQKILFDYIEKTGKSLLEAMNDVRHLFKKVE